MLRLIFYLDPLVYVASADDYEGAQYQLFPLPISPPDCKAACRSVGLRLCTLATRDCCSFYHDTGSGFACTNECPPGVSPNETFFCSEFTNDFTNVILILCLHHNLKSTDVQSQIVVLFLMLRMGWCPTTKPVRVGMRHSLSLSPIIAAVMAMH